MSEKDTEGSFLFVIKADIDIMLMLLTTLAFVSRLWMARTTTCHCVRQLLLFFFLNIYLKFILLISMIRPKQLQSHRIHEIYVS